LTILLKKGIFTQQNIPKVASPSTGNKIKALFMRHPLLIIALLLACFSHTHATSIRGKLLAPVGTHVALYDYRLHVSDTVGSTKSGGDSIFLMPLPPNAYHGFYRLAWEGGFLDVLYDGEAITFEQTGDNNFNVLRGQSWRMYRDTKDHLRRLRENQSRLTQLTTAYEGESKAIKVAEKQIKKLQKAEAKLVKTIKKEDLFAYRHLRFELPFLATNSAEMTAAYTRENYLDLLDLSDTVQLHYNLVPQMLVAYFRLFEPGENEDAEILGMSYLNRVFDKLDAHPLYYNSVADFLRIGFQQMNQPRSIQLIAQKVATHRACVDPRLQERPSKLSTEARLAAAGAIAPPLQQLVKWDGSAVEKTAPGSGLLIFWSSECPHCLQDLPPLHLWLKNNRPSIQVTAIGLDAWEVGWKAESLQLEAWQHLRESHLRRRELLARRW
jgi:hypothetical protein